MFFRKKLISLNKKIIFLTNSSFCWDRFSWASSAREVWRLSMLSSLHLQFFILLLQFAQFRSIATPYSPFSLFLAPESFRERTCSAPWWCAGLSKSSDANPFNRWFSQLYPRSQKYLLWIQTSYDLLPSTQRHILVKFILFPHQLRICSPPFDVH